MVNKLKSCPFCGEDKVRTVKTGWFKKYYITECYYIDCRVKPKASSILSSASKLIWNTRL